MKGSNRNVRRSIIGCPDGRSRDLKSLTKADSVKLKLRLIFRVEQQICNMHMLMGENMIEFNSIYLTRKDIELKMF